MSQTPLADALATISREEFDRYLIERGALPVKVTTDAIRQLTAIADAAADRPPTVSLPSGLRRQ